MPPCHKYLNAQDERTNNCQISTSDTITCIFYCRNHKFYKCKQIAGLPTSMKEGPFFLIKLYLSFFGHYSTCISLQADNILIYTHQKNSDCVHSERTTYPFSETGAGETGSHWSCVADSDSDWLCIGLLYKQPVSLHLFLGQLTCHY